MHAATSPLHTLLDAANDDERPVIRTVTVRIGLLWWCASGWYNAPAHGQCGDCGTTREDTCRVDSVDPTPNEPGPICHARYPGRTFGRTRRPDHRGRQHVAGTDQDIAAVWGRDQ